DADDLRANMAAPDHIAQDSGGGSAESTYGPAQNRLQKARVLAKEPVRARHFVLATAPSDASEVHRNSEAGGHFLLGATNSLGNRGGGDRARPVDDWLGLVHCDSWSGSTLWDHRRLTVVLDWDCAGRMASTSARCTRASSRTRPSVRLPTRSRAPITVTSCPPATSRRAAARPAKPAPTTTRLLIRSPQSLQRDSVRAAQPVQAEQLRCRVLHCFLLRAVPRQTRG